MDWDSWDIAAYERNGKTHQVFDSHGDRLGPVPRASTIAESERVVVQVGTPQGNIHFTIYGPWSPGIDPETLWADIENEIEDAMDSDSYGVGDAA